MTTLISIFVATSLIALISIVGISLLRFPRKNLDTLILSLVALSAGAMLGNALFHLLPETIELAETGPIGLETALLILTGSFVLSLLFEQALYWHHCHHPSHHEAQGDHPSVKPYAHLVIWSDAIHNFIDGLIIAASFAVSPAFGVATAAAVALHEIPQELGDFAVLVHAGWGKRKALLRNFFSASTVVLGGIIGYFVTNSVDIAIPILLPFAAGGFIYIAAADLLPEIKHEEKAGASAVHFLMFLLGLMIMIVTALVE